MAAPRARVESLMNQLRVLIYMRLFELVCMLSVCLSLCLFVWNGQIVFCHRHHLKRRLSIAHLGSVYAQALLGTPVLDFEFWVSWSMCM